MGEWKIPISVRVPQTVKDDLQKFAGREHRKLANLSEILMVWACKQLKAAKSTERLLKCNVHPSSRRSKRTPITGDARSHG
jgi:hypothetical protein